MAQKLLTSVVGSYPQPDWLVDRTLLTKMMAPRVRVREVWRIPTRASRGSSGRCDDRRDPRAGARRHRHHHRRRDPPRELLEQVRERARRHRPRAARRDRRANGHRVPVPIVSGAIRRREPVEVRDVAFLRAHTDKTIKITLPGPFTMTQQVVNEHYESEESLAFAYAEAVNEEIHDLFAAGADIVQLDEPWLQARAENARRYGVQAIDRALAGVKGTTALHLCFGYAALVKDKPSSGYSFLSELADSSVDQISIEAAQPNLDLSVLASSALEDRSSSACSIWTIAPSRRRSESPSASAPPSRSCPRTLDRDARLRMKYLPREVAFGKLQALAEAARVVRAEL